MSADDPSTRFMSMSRKTNKYFLSWCAVLSPCHKARGSPRHPALTASQFCGHATGVGIPTGRTLGRSSGAGRAFVQVDRVARHRPPAPASPVRVRLCRLRPTQTNRGGGGDAVGEVTTTDDTIMQPAPSPWDHRQRVLAPARRQHHSERRQLLSQRCNNKLTRGEDPSPLYIPQNCDAVKAGWRGKPRFCRRVADDVDTAHHQGKDLFCFQ